MNLISKFFNNSLKKFGYRVVSIPKDIKNEMQVDHSEKDMVLQLVHEFADKNKIDRSFSFKEIRKYLTDERLQFFHLLVEEIVVRQNISLANKSGRHWNRHWLFIEVSFTKRFKCSIIWF